MYIRDKVISLETLELSQNIAVRRSEISNSSVDQHIIKCTRPLIKHEEFFTKFLIEFIASCLILYFACIQVWVNNDLLI